jgi:hypothetical protein
MVSDSFCIGFSRFSRNPNCSKHIDHDSMAEPHLFRQRPSDRRQEYAPIRPTGNQTVTLQPGNRLDDAHMRDAKAPGDVGRAGFALGRQQVRDQLDIVLA